MTSEITEEEDDHQNHIFNKEADKIRIRQIISYQKSLYLSSSLSSSSSSCSSSCSSSRQSSSLLDLMKEGSTSLRRLFDMEHTSLGNHLMDYSASPVVKPILLWGSDSDNEGHDDPWAEIKRIDHQNHHGGVLSSKGSFDDDQEFVQQPATRLKTPKRRLIRTKSYKSLPRLSFWRCGGFKFRLRLIRRLRIVIRGRKL